MTDVADDGTRPSSLPESAASDGESNRRASRVRCVVHNFPDDDDDDNPESTIRSLLEPDLVVQHCQLSATGLCDFSSVMVRVRVSFS